MKNSKYSSFRNIYLNSSNHKLKNNSRLQNKSIEKIRNDSSKRNTARSRKSMRNSLISDSIVNNERKSSKFLNSLNEVSYENKIIQYEFDSSPKINKMTSCEFPNSCFKIPTTQEMSHYDAINSIKDKEDCLENEISSDQTSHLKQICSASYQ